MGAVSSQPGRLPEAGYGAEGAAVGAALPDAQVRRVLGGQPVPIALIPEPNGRLPHLHHKTYLAYSIALEGRAWFGADTRNTHYLTTYLDPATGPCCLLRPIQRRPQRARQAAVVLKAHKVVRLRQALCAA